MFSSKLIAQDDDAPSAGEVAKKLADPNASIGFFAFPIDYIHYGGNGEGASSQNAFKISFQPSLPYVIKPGKNIFVRPLIPIIISQPIITEDGSFQDEGVDLGDIGFDAAYGITWPNKLITIFGMVGSAPTATDKKLGTGRWMLGPEVFLGKTTKWGMFGVLVTHSWSVNKNNSGAHDQLVTPYDFMIKNDF